MKKLSKFAAIILYLTGNCVAWGQFRAPGGLPPGFHHALLDVLESSPAFSGQAQIQLTNDSGKAPTVMNCSIAMLSGNMRLEVNSFNPGSNMPPAEAAQLKNMHSISILRPDRNRWYLVFPEFKSYVEMDYYKNSGTEAEPPPQINRVPVGKEMIGDLACIKSQWNITEVNGEKYDVTVWTSDGNGNFPIRIKVGPPAALVEFRNWRFEAPDGSLFEPPAGYIKYEGIAKTIQDEVAAKKTNSPSQNAISP